MPALDKKGLEKPFQVPKHSTGKPLVDDINPALPIIRNIPYFS